MFQFSNDLRYGVRRSESRDIGPKNHVREVRRAGTANRGLRDRSVSLSNSTHTFGHVAGGKGREAP